MKVLIKSILALLCIRVVRPYCVDRTIGKYVRLTDYGFHEAFENNPQIIFGVKRDGLKFGKRFLPQACAFLSRFLEQGYWKGLTPKSLKRIGLAEPLLDCLDMLLMSKSTCGYNDLKDFEISENAVKPQGKIVVYSVLTGVYDNIKDPLYVTPDVDYVLFTNVDVRTKVWKVVKVTNEGLSDLLLSRRIKMLPHVYLPQKYDMSIYVDANVFVFGDITMLATRLNDHCSFAVSSHSVRNSVTDEMHELVALNKVDAALAQSVLSRYRDEGFNDDLGLAECTVLVRKHDDKGVIGLMNEWWDEFVGNMVYRDQISLPYCIWKTHFKDCELMKGHVMNNQYCTVKSHLKKNVPQS
jgi:hypothetical protein